MEAEMRMGAISPPLCCKRQQAIHNHVRQLQYLRRGQAQQTLIGQGRAGAIQEVPGRQDAANIQRN